MKNIFTNIITNKIYKKLCIAFVVGLVGIGQINNDSMAYSHYERIAGADRYETSLKVSSNIKSEIAVIASGNSFADALSSVNISNKFGGIIVLTNGKTNINSELKDRGVKKVYIVGGYNTISKNFEDAISGGFEVVRISGEDRYLTSMESIKLSGYTELGIADGRNYPDALSSTPLLKQENCGLLLVDGSKEYTLGNDMNIKYTFGGKKSVNKEGGERIFGDSRYDTAINIMKKINNANNIAFVSGNDYADALSSTNILLTGKTIIMPVDNNVRYELVEFVKSIENVYFIGGEKSISKKVENILLDKNEKLIISNEGVSDQYDIEENTKKINRQIADIELHFLKIKSLKNIPDKNSKMEELNKKVEILKNDYKIYRNNIYYKIENFEENREEFKMLISELDSYYNSFINKLSI